MAARHRLKWRQGDLFERYLGLDGRMRHRQKIRLPLEREGTRVDDHAVDMEVGGIHARVRLDIADVAGAHIQLAETQRARRVLIDIGDLALDDSHLIDVEGINRLHGLLPAALLYRHLVPSLMDDLREVEVERRPLDPQISDHARP